MFATEEALQYWLADQLRAAGYRPQLEVVTHPQHKTRADIVCGDTVIECKKVLDRDAMHQASSQAAMYAQHLNKPRKVIVGMPPFSMEAQRSAKSAAAAIMSADPNLSVYWVNQSGVFPLEQRRLSVLDAVGAPDRQPAPVPVPAPFPAPTSPIRQPVPGPIRIPASLRRVPLWKLAGALVYVIAGAWFGGGVGALCGALGGVGLIVWP